jgi:hypothetical protein
MTKRNPKRPNGHVRPIRTRRDFDGASAAVKTLSSRSDRDSVAERRMQALLHELDRYDEAQDEAEQDSALEEDYPGPRRRWSDESDD